MNGYPDVRLRRLRATESRRRLFDQPMPGPEKFIWPVFLTDTGNNKEAIDALPGQFRYGTEALLRDLEEPVRDGIGGVLLFGLVANAFKNAKGSAAWDERGMVQQAIQAIKRAYPHLVIFTDVCLCAYTDHGHCGPLDGGGGVANDEACECLARTALSHALAGADGVAPSAMMDGQVAAIRQALGKAGLQDTLLLSYSTKFASSMYGPFRDAEQSAPSHGDRQGYQASWRDPAQAVRESLFDVEEGADILMVKPALFYLDILSKIRQATNLPLAAYNVSGEYAMLWHAAAAGAGDLRSMVRESLFAIQRAGADLIISYWASHYRSLISD